MPFPFLTNLTEGVIEALPTLEKLSSSSKTIDQVISAARELGFSFNTKEARSVVRGYRDINERREYQNNLDPGTFYDPSKISQSQSQLRTPYQVVVKVTGKSMVSGLEGERIYKYNFQKPPNDQMIYDMVAQDYNDFIQNPEEFDAGSDLLIPQQVTILDRISSS